MIDILLAVGLVLVSAAGVGQAVIGLAVLKRLRSIEIYLETGLQLSHRRKPVSR